MYKAPPPEVSPRSSTRPTRRAASPAASRSRPSRRCPIGWAEHVLADGHWGRALREYMRDYNHWTRARGAQRAASRTRATASRWPTRHDAYGLPVARFDSHAVRERQGQHGLLHRGHQRDLEARRGAGHAHHPTLRPPRRRRPDGLVRREQRRRRRPPRLGRRRTCSSPTAASARPRGGQPGADDHGARRPVSPSGSRQRRRAWRRTRPTAHSPGRSADARKKPEVVVVTGSSAGVGRAVAHAFASAEPAVGAAGSRRDGPRRRRPARSSRSAVRRWWSRPTSPMPKQVEAAAEASRRASGRSTCGSTTRWRPCSPRSRT